MIPRSVMTWFLAFLLAVLMIAMTTIAQGNGVLANFVCKDGVCYTSEADVDRLEAALKMLVEKLSSCGAVSI
jgi:hypothetical protein